MTGHAPPPSPRASIRGLAAVLILAALLLAAVQLLVPQPEREAVTYGPGATIVEDPAPAELVPAGALFAGFVAIDAAGTAAPLADAGRPAVLMVNSTSCGFCKRALADLGALAGGRPLPALRVLTLEGAGQGRPMLAREGLTGAALLGPATDAARVLFTYRFQGTPTFIAIDGQGRVRRIMPGYPGRAELARWLPVMLGGSDWPAGG
jgi:hypothetical protein